MNPFSLGEANGPKPMVTAVLKQLAVVGGLRGRGLGAALLKHTIAEAHQRGFHQLLVDVPESRLNFYKANGWETSPRGDQPESKDGDEIRDGFVFASQSPHHSRPEFGIRFTTENENAAAATAKPSL